MKRLFVTLAVALAVGVFLGDAQRAQAGITAIEANLDGGGWATLGSNAGPSVGPINVNVGGVMTVMNLSAFSLSPAELISTNLVLINNSASTHTLQIVIASTDFTSPSGPVALTSTVGGTAINAAAGSSVTFQSFVDPNNHSDHTGEVGAFTSGLQLTNFPNGGTAHGTASPLVGPYSLIQEYDITLVGNDHVQFQGDTALSVPEPSSLLLGGFGAASTLGYGFKRRKVSA